MFKEFRDSLDLKEQQANQVFQVSLDLKELLDPKEEPVLMVSRDPLDLLEPQESQDLLDLPVKSDQLGLLVHKELLVPEVLRERSE